VGENRDFFRQLQQKLDLLREGNPQAREDIIDCSCQRLRHLVGTMLSQYPRLQQWEDTDDVLQDAMLRLHRALEQVQPQSVAQFFGLAATHIRRTLLDLVRRHFGPEGPGGYSHVDVGNGDWITSRGGPTTPKAWAECYEALDGLPEQEREVVDLLWFDGLTQAEAAEVLGISERTIRRRWYAARYSLYKALGGGQNDE
jgi:DNA-directed RNA polymerase specialized sigma24 family protein